MRLHADAAAAAEIDGGFEQLRRTARQGGRPDHRGDERVFPFPARDEAFQMADDICDCGGALGLQGIRQIRDEFQRQRSRETLVGVAHRHRGPEADVDVGLHDGVAAGFKGPQIDARHVENRRGAGPDHLDGADLGGNIKIARGQFGVCAAVGGDHHPGVERIPVAKSFFEGLIGVGVGVDEAGHDDLALCVQHAAARRQAGSDGGDLPVADQNIRTGADVMIEKQAVSDQKFGQGGPREYEPKAILAGLRASNLIGPERGIAGDGCGQEIVRCKQRTRAHASYVYCQIRLVARWFHAQRRRRA